MSAIESDGEIMEGLGVPSERKVVKDEFKTEMARDQKKNKKMQSWTTNQLLNVNRRNPAYQELRKIMRETSDQLGVSSVEAENYDKAVTLIMGKFAALKKQISNEAVRKKVGKIMIYCYNRRMEYRNRSAKDSGDIQSAVETTESTAPKLPTPFRQKPTSKESTESTVLKLPTPSRQKPTSKAKRGPSGWTAAQLLHRRKGGNPAWFALRGALKERSDNYDIKSRRSEYYNQAVTEAMEQFEALKPLMTDEAIRSRLGIIMVTNAQKRYYKEVFRAGRLDTKIKNSAKNRVTLTANKLKKKVIARSMPRKLGRNRTGKKPLHPKAKKSSGVATVEDKDSESSMDERTGSEDTDQSDEDEKVTIGETIERMVPQSRESASLYRLLTVEAQDLIFHHHPDQAWKKLQKMNRIISESLGLVGLKQDSACDAVKQILGSSPVLARYVDDAKVVQKFRYRMLRQLQCRLSKDRKSLAEMCMTEGDWSPSPLKKLTSIKGISVVPTVKEANAAAVNKASTASKQQSSSKSPKEARKNGSTPKQPALVESATNSPSGLMPCQGYPHQDWTRQELLKIDKPRSCPARKHLLKVQRYMSTKYNIVRMGDEGFDTAVTEVMNHFAALRPLVHVRRYRHTVGKQMAKNSRHRVWKLKTRGIEETTREELDEDGEGSDKLIEENQKGGGSKKGKGKKERPAGANNLEAPNELESAPKSRKRKREKSQSEDDQLQVNKAAKSKKTIEGYMPVQKKPTRSQQDAERSPKETESPSSPQRKKMRLQTDASGRKLSKADSEDLNSSRESMSSEKSGQSRSGSKKMTIEDYLVMPKRMSSILGKRLEEVENDASEKQDVNNNQKDGSHFDFSDDDDDDAFETPPSRPIFRKSSCSGIMEVSDAGEGGHQKDTRKKAPINNRKRSSVGNVTKTSSREPNNPEVKESSALNSNIHILSNWLSADDTEGLNSKKSHDLVEKEDSSALSKDRQGKDGDTRENVVPTQMERDRYETNDDEPVVNSQQGENPDKDLGMDVEVISDSGSSEVLILESVDVEEKQGPIRPVQTCEEEGNRSDEDEMGCVLLENKNLRNTTDEEQEGKQNTKKSRKRHQLGKGRLHSFWGPKDRRMAGKNHPDEDEMEEDVDVIEVRDSSNEVLDISPISVEKTLTPRSLLENLDSEEETAVQVSSAQRKVKHPMEGKSHKKETTDAKKKKNKKPEIFEVDTILKYAKDTEGGDWYYVKWLGYASDQNTWEPKEHLSGCSKLLKVFHRQLKRAKLSHRKRKLGEHVEDDELIVQSKKPKWVKQPTSPISTEALRSVVREELKNWAISLNYICTDTAPIVVENEVDFEGPPCDFTYINDYVAGSGVTIPNDPLVGCSCTRCSDEEPECCPQNSGVRFAYNRLKHIRAKPGTPIYECNKYCKCGEDCPNRVVQLGRKYPMSIFRTSNNRGWGVKTLVDIRRNTFVMEYVGEVITSEEAERRGKEYDANGRTYLFDLDYNDDDCPFTVDAGKSGNISHFVNHSCDPNLVVYGVWVNCVDPRLPRIALFASRDIKAGEELTFDYQMTGEVGEENPSDATVQQVPCRCGAESCRGFLV